MKVVLSRDVPKVVPPWVGQVVQRLLERNGLRVENISNWIVHSGGVAILDQVAGQLGLDSAHDLRYSWKALHEYGNVSSATVGIAAQLMHRDPTTHQGYVVGVAMGAGAQIAACLAKYG